MVVTELHYISPVMKYFVFVGFFRRSMCRYISILTRSLALSAVIAHQVSLSSPML